MMERIAARPMPSDRGGMHGRFTSLSWLRTIRARLYLAFGAAAGITVVGSLFALIASANIAATLTEIVFRSMPATIESFRLSEDTNRLIASAPRLMTAANESARTQIAGEIAVQSRQLQSRIEHLRALDAGESDALVAARGAMDERLEALSQAVADRIMVSDQRRALTLAVRRSHEALLEAITPAIDDANFDLMTKSQASETRTELNQSIDGLRRLLEVQADANLLAGLLIESSMVTDISSLPPMRDLITSAERHINTNLKALTDSDQRSRIVSLYGKLAALAGESGVLALRASELRDEAGAQQVYAAALAEAAKLRTAVENLIQHQNTVAETLSVQAISQIKWDASFSSCLALRRSSEPA